MNHLKIIYSEKPAFQKHVRMVLYIFIGLVAALLLLEVMLAIMQSSVIQSSALIVKYSLIAVAFPLSIFFFYREFQHYIRENVKNTDELFVKNPQAMWIYDTTTLDFLKVNNSAVSLYGYTEEEFLKMRITEIRPLEDVPALLDDVNQSEANVSLDYQWSGVWRHRKKDGQMIYAEISSHKILFNGKRAALVLSYDITDKIMQDLKLQTLNQELEQKVRKRTNDLLHLNRKLIEQNRTIKTVNHDLAVLSNELTTANAKIKEHAELKSRFISMISHEFRTPLTTIRIATEFIGFYHDRISDQQLLSKVDSICSQVTRMNELLNDVLTIGHSESPKIMPVVRSLDLPAFIRALVDEVSQANMNSHTIDLKMDVSDVIVYSDEKLLRNIFINLLSNAIKYSPKSNRIEFDVYQEDLLLLFKISDHGLGMAADDIPKIFDPFFRTAEVRDIQGTGLGLPIVKRALELVGGKIDVHSELGIGSTFIVTLPVKQTEAVSAEQNISTYI